MNKSTLKHALRSGIAVAALSAAGFGLGAAPAAAAPVSTWDALAECESGGNWSINTGNGYYGGLQFSPSTWAGFGGTGSAAAASKEQQIAVAEKVLAVQGWNAWPACSAKLGLRGTAAPAVPQAAVAVPAAPQPAPAAPAVGGPTYTIQAGDTLGAVSARLGVPGGWQALVAANADTLPNPNLVFPGQVLRLPA
jgi:LysM repeat protein